MWRFDAGSWQTLHLQLLVSPLRLASTPRKSCHCFYRGITSPVLVELSEEGSKIWVPASVYKRQSQRDREGDACALPELRVECWRIALGRNILAKIHRVAVYSLNLTTILLPSFWWHVSTRNSSMKISCPPNPRQAPKQKDPGALSHYSLCGPSHESTGDCICY